MKNRTRILGAALVAATMAGVSAQAANVTWTGGASDGVWSNTANWDLGALPAAADGNWATIDNGDTVAYFDGMTNSVEHHSVQGGSVFNFTGGSLNDNKAGNTRRTYIGNGGTVGVLNQSGGKYSIGHVLRIGIGVTTPGSAVNLSGGEMNVYRGGNSANGNPGTSVQIGNASGYGALNITNSIFTTRTGIEIGQYGTMCVYGAASTIGVGGYGGAGDGALYISSNGVLKVGISTNGVSPIVLEDSSASGVPTVLLNAGSVLDVGFVDGAMETNIWPVIVNTNGTWNNLGMVPAAGVDTNDWGFIISNNVLYVGYGLGLPFGEEVLGPPPAQRDLYWTGAGGDTDPANPTNWVLDTAATQTTDWGPYDDDLWHIADASVVGVVPGTNYVVDYDDSAVFNGHRALSVGTGAEGTFNYLSGDLSFTKVSGSRQEFGLNAGGVGTLNVNAGALTLNAARFGVNGGQGALNLNGGTLTISRAYGDYSLWVGHGGSSTGTVTVTGGRMFTRTGAKLGDGSSAYGIFNVEGSAATDIGIGSNNSLDGYWVQNAGSVIRFKIDAGGVTPIKIVEKDAASGGQDGNVTFKPGSILDVGWMPGVTNFGTFDLMTWDGVLVESNLTLAASVDTNVWSWSFVDANSDGTNDTLRATAYGETANGTPFDWLISYGLTEADDTMDNDGDGFLTWEEYIAGTDPTNGTSLLQITSGQDLGGGNFAITWESVAGKSYSIITNTSLAFPAKGTEASGIIGLPNETSYTGTVGGASAVFYEVGVQK